MKTYFASNDVVKKWYVIDATDQILGRMSVRIAKYLRGKHKPEYTPHNADAGDYVIVINADKVRVTGKKYNDKIYYWHTGYPGGIKKKSFRHMQAQKPERIIEIAVKGMLPKNPLGRLIYTRLKVYAGSEHPHIAQQPEFIQFEDMR